MKNHTRELESPATMKENTWIGGILELGSKVRYGMTTRGVPIYRFVPYDKKQGPYAVGCSQRSLNNVHAIVEAVVSVGIGEGLGQGPGLGKAQAKDPAQDPFKTPKANLIQILGEPSPSTELAILLATYAFDSKKHLRKHLPTILNTFNTKREKLEGYTFHIDPPGCKDVDDSFTFLRTESGWRISINIADVAEYVTEGSDVDSIAKEKATSFYSPSGTVLAAMLPSEIETKASLLPGECCEEKLTLSLQFLWLPGYEPIDFQWIETITQTTASYTYDEAMRETRDEMKALQAFHNQGVGETNDDSHKWVETMMILYNKKAGERLRDLRCGILRSHTTPQLETLDAWTSIDPSLTFMAYESAHFISANSTQSIQHYGLGCEAYAYASSPIRRYCDIVNQRILKGSLPTYSIDALVTHLNRRQRQEKAFRRDIFFMTVLKDDILRPVVGIVISALKVYVPAWTRVIKIKNVEGLPDIKTWISLKWYHDMRTPCWKDRMVFSWNVLEVL